LVPVDISNPAVVEWQVDHFAGEAEVLPGEYDAVTLDNVYTDNRAQLCGVFRDGQFVRKYDPADVHDPRWCNDLVGWLARLRRRLHALEHPLRVIANVSPMSSLDDACTRGVLNELDGVLVEGAFRDEKLHRLVGEGWSARARLAIAAQREGRSYYAIEETNDPPTRNDFCAPVVKPDDIQWALASYLSIKQSDAALAITGLEQYGCDLWYPELDAPIGHPCEPLRRAGEVYVRTHSGGVSVVNPQPFPAVAHLGVSPLRDLWGSALAPDMVLPATSGLVALASAPLCP
jgi:hypothetical protein